MVDWQLGLAPDVGGTFLKSFQQGQEQGRETASRNALATFASNPDSPQAMNALIQADPRLGMQLREQQRRQQQAAREQQRADLPTIGRLLDYSTDPQRYAQARSMAQQMGIDASQIPEQYDPAWIDKQRILLKAVQDPAKAEALSAAGKIAMDMGFRPGTPEYSQKVVEIWTADQVKTIPYTQGGGVAGYNAATGQTETIIAPNPGGYAPGTPVNQGGAGGGVREGATATNPQTGAKIIYRNGQWQPVTQGGGGGGVTSNFLDGV